MAEPRPLGHRRAAARDEGGRRRPGLRASGAGGATGCRRSRTCSRRAPWCSSRRDRHRRVRHRPRRARGRGAAVRRPRWAGARSAVLESSTRKLDVPLGELVESVLEARLRRRAPTARARSSCPRAARTTRAALETWLGDARARKGATCAPPSAATRPRSCRRRRMNAKQALDAATRPRRTADYVARTQALTDIQEALGLEEAPLRIECYDVSHLERHQHRRLDGGLRGRPAAQERVPHASRSRSYDRRHRLASHQVLTRRLAYLAAAGRGRAIGARRPAPSRGGRMPRDVRAPQEDSPTARACSWSTAASRRSSAAARALERSRSRRASTCRGIAKRLEEIWLPGRTSPSSCRATARPSSSSSASATRRTASPSPTSARSASATSARCSAEIPGLGPARVKELLAALRLGRRACTGRRDERDRRGRGVGPSPRPPRAHLAR